MAGVLKTHFPGCTLIFLGKSYTRPVVEACEFVDEFLDVDELLGTGFKVQGTGQTGGRSEQRTSNIDQLKALGADIIIHAFPVKAICKAAKEAGIPLRIATSHRWYSWLYCNKLLHFSRKNSDLHEAQLNLKLLEALGIKREWSLQEIPSYYGLTPPLPPSFPHLKGEGKAGTQLLNLILHPKSKGSAREWGLDNFSRLIDLLPADKVNIHITGTKEEGLLMKDFLHQHRERVNDMTGRMTLQELMGFIGTCDVLVAASTGPLHIAAALGIKAIGLFAPMKPIHPGRWAPLGKDAHFLVLDKECKDCRKTMDCACIREISAEAVAALLKLV